MRFKQLFAIAASVTLLSSLTQSPTQAQSNDSPVIEQTNPSQPSSLPGWIWIVGGGVFLLIFLPKIGWIVGLISVGESEVGIITKKFSSKNLAPGKLTALNGEAGLQADTLAPGWHFGFFPWQYSVKKEPVVTIPQDEIGLIVANDGSQIPADRILGKRLDCDRFQDARAFLLNGGEKGRQIDILTTGNYRINTAIFQVITSVNCGKYGMNPAQLRLHQIESERVGIATTLDGKPIETGEIAGEPIPNHDNYQDVQKFIAAGGRRGLQEQVILSGSWNLNPWFVHVEQIAMTTVPIGHVGVVISYVGKSNHDLSGDAFTHGNIVSKGDKGVWVEPIYPGKHPLNKQVMEVQLVPTTNVVLNTARSERQAEAAEHIRQALKQYDVQAVDTLIGMITPPPELMQTLTDRKIAQEQEKTYEVQRIAQIQRQELVRATALAEIQNQVVTAEQGVNIAELEAAAKVKEAEGKAESIRSIGQAKADAYKAGVDALGEDTYGRLQVMQVVGERQVRIVPNVSVTNAGAAGGNGLVDALLGMWAQNPSTIPTGLPQLVDEPVVAHLATNGVKPGSIVSLVTDRPQDVD
jgi:uncharacterized membrane protein YqiK